MRVLKFGGTSLSNANQFIHVANILEQRSQGELIATVLSAPAMITNRLISIIDVTLRGHDVLESVSSIEIIFNTLLENITQFQSKFDHIKICAILKKEFVYLKKLLYGISLLKYCPDNVNANIICLGEKLSIILMEGLLTARQLKTIVINPIDKLIARGEYLAATIDIEESMRRISTISTITHVDIILMAGFTAGNEKGELVALGRNGSDYSAAVLAACLRADRCEIWTDVDGIYTCDPHQVPEAKLLRSLSYQEAMELSYFGAKILHPRTIAPIAQFNIPCLIKNIFKPDAPGTLIDVHSSIKNDIVKGITYLHNMAMLNISGPGMKGMVGMAARVFSAMSRATCSVVLITQSSSEYSISFCIPSQELSKACITLNEEFHLELKNKLLEPIDVMHNLAIISVVGDGMRTKFGVSSKLFRALAMASINIIAIAQGSSERSISVVVHNNVATIGMQAIHRVLYDADRLIELFIIGVGGVGHALITQIKRQYHWLKKNKYINLKICGIANSKVMCLDMNGVDLNIWPTLLKQTDISCNLKNLLSIIRDSHLENPVVVDCTNSVEVANFYVDFLSNGCHVIAPNKKANTGSMQYYRTIRDTMHSCKKKFLYDTNVGAGLPVIENLQNLLHAGDELISFSGILSGSLSFIFGKLDEGVSLSAATLLAQKKGYTEPNPIDDLSGIDIARKLLVIAREIGYELELGDIYIDPLLPNNITNNDVSDDFFKQLSLLDDSIFIKVEEARALGRVLRCVGNIQKGRCFVRVESIDNKHPLFSIKDGENALAFLTRYYQPLPLILRGYGAGNNVTAAGVFADVLRTLS